MSTSSIEDVAARIPHATVFLTLETGKLPGARSIPYPMRDITFGMDTSGEVFNTAMSNIFRNREGVEVIVSDLLVHGASKEEPDKHLRQIRKSWQKVKRETSKMCWS